MNNTARYVESGTITISGIDGFNHQGVGQMNEDKRKQAKENNKKKLYFMCEGTTHMHEMSCNMSYTVDEVTVANTLACEGLVFTLTDDGRLERVKEIKITQE